MVQWPAITINLSKPFSRLMTIFGATPSFHAEDFLRHLDVVDSLTKSSPPNRLIKSLELSSPNGVDRPTSRHRYFNAKFATMHKFLSSSG